MNDNKKEIHRKNEKRRRGLSDKRKAKEDSQKKRREKKKKKVHQLRLQSQSKHLPTEHNWIPRRPVLLPGSPLQVDKHAEQTSPRAGRQTDPPQVIANRVHKS